MVKVEVYTRIPCPYCNMAKRLLETRGIEFEEIDLTDEPDRLVALKEKTGMRTVPQIFFGDRLIGGFQELQELDRTTGLQVALEKAKG